MDRFAIEIVSAESFIDDDPGFKGKSYTVQTYIIRLNHVALKAWLAAAAADATSMRSASSPSFSMFRYPLFYLYLS